MGDITKLWYLKGSGGDWASTKCELDECYSIPFDSANDSLYLQADLPTGVHVDEIWLCFPDGTHSANVKQMTEWKVIEKTGLHRIIFRVPNHVACSQGPTGGGPTCFHFEMPLLSNDTNALTGTLVSEPFHCPECEPTVKISSDYCLSPTDIFGDLIFHTEGIGGTQSGNLTEAKNDLRIQAVLKQMPSKVTASRNLRCFNYRSNLQQRYKLQGAVDFPLYIAELIESIFSGKKLYVNDEEYLLSGEQLFTERNTDGRSMLRLEVELVKCERRKVHTCVCPGEEEEPPVVLG